jgi:hypothetical protein
MLESIGLAGFSPSYPRSGMMAWHLLGLLPQFIVSAWREHQTLKKLIAQRHFDIVISDNRYGLCNKKISSVLITHQVMIKTGAWLRFAEYPLWLVSRLLISRFDECWIPDSAEAPGLSGELAHKYPLPSDARYIGPLSRFSVSESSKKHTSAEAGITVIISGPEPQRSIFQNLVTTQLSGLSHKATIICGKPESGTESSTDLRLTVLPHLASKELGALITSSSLVICRSGYSSIMDLQALGAKALFVPTPGQTEQIYLAELHQNQKTALYRAQNVLNLTADIPEAMKYEGFKPQTPDSGLKKAIAELKKK